MYLNEDMLLYVLQTKLSNPYWLHLIKVSNYKSKVSLRTFVEYWRLMNKINKQPQYLVFKLNI